MQSVYLDYNSTTPTDPDVVEAMLPYLREQWANPSSAHNPGNQVRRAIDRAREQVATLICAAEPSEIIFTSGATESNNTAILSAIETLGAHASVITSPTEHAAVIGPVQWLEQRGQSVKWISVDENGRPDLEEVTSALKESPAALASFMWANNETGVLSPIEQLAEAAAEADAMFHTDAVQMAGKMPLSVKELPIHMLSLSAHKLCGPKGVGALYLRKGTRMKPFLRGGHQERARRAGTENVPAIIGFGKACEIAQKTMEQESSRVERLRNRLEEGILSSCKGAQLHGGGAQRLPNTLNIGFQQLDGEAILYMLDDQNVSVSTGSPCESGSLEASHVLKAMGVERTYVNGAIRFSLGKYSTDQDVDTVLERLPAIIDRCRSLAPQIKDES